METDIALIATGYLLTRITIVAAIGYLIYRLVRRDATRVPVKSNSHYAKERLITTRRGR